MTVKKVKIVATLGPASDDPKIIYELAKEGVNVFRINLSHATEAEILSRIAGVRAAEQKLGVPLAILGDMAGPKIRIQDMKPDVIWEKGQNIIIQTEPIVGDAERVSLNQPTLVPQLKKGAEVFIDDGKIKLEVETEGHIEVVAKVIVGGLVKSRKGFNAQGISLKTKGLSDKDRKDLQFVVEHGVDALAVSFVQSAADIETVRELLPKDSKIKLVAKIETMKSIEAIEKIIDATDIIMVARGDLGLAVQMEDIPHLQKKIIEMCLRRARPVITATQMLESMTTSPLPTRAEVTDVANAILDGTDAVMLSGETAAGNFPVETVKMMTRIIKRTEGQVQMHDYHQAEGHVAHAISMAVGHIADEIDSPFIMCFTLSGHTPRRIARHHHQKIILAMSPDEIVARQMNFSWGVFPMKIEPLRDFGHMIEQARNAAKNNPVANLHSGEVFALVAGMPFGKSGLTNLAYVERV